MLISAVNCSLPSPLVFKMAVSRDLSVEVIRDFMLENGGKVTNHDLVKHFRGFLTNPETRGIGLLFCDFVSSKSVSNACLASPRRINIFLYHFLVLCLCEKCRQYFSFTLFRNPLFVLCCCVTFI